MSNSLHKVAVICSECGDIHAEKWIENQGRHASRTTLFMLCEACKENEYQAFVKREYPIIDAKNVPIPSLPIIP